jgi:hypothetical protein
MKYKPTILPITKEIAKSKEWGWLALPSLFIEAGIAIDQAKKGNDWLACGKCSWPMTLKSGLIPKVCAHCGAEIDWVGIKTRIIRICPKCNAQGGIGEEFCAIHTPAVRLVSKEVPL